MNAHTLIPLRSIIAICYLIGRKRENRDSTNFCRMHHEYGISHEQPGCNIKEKQRAKRNEGSQVDKVSFIICIERMRERENIYLST